MSRVSIFYTKLFLAAFAAASLAWTGSVQSERDQHLERARALMRKYPLIDGHNDLPWSFRRGGGNTFSATDLRKERKGGQTDIPRARQGLLGAQFWSVYIPTSITGPRAVKTTEEQISIVRRLCLRYPDVFQMAYTADDVERIFKAGKIASLIGMEGGHSIDSSIKHLRNMYKLGARYMTLTHNRNTPWADSANDKPKHGGLSDLGRQIVREMNRLGMLVDLSHVSDETMHDALDIAKAPVIFSHSSAYALCRHPRNVPDDVLARVKKNGGVVMVVILDSYVSQELNEYELERARQRMELVTEVTGTPTPAVQPYVETDRRPLTPAQRATVERMLKDWEAENPAPVATLEQVADHIDHVRKVAGIDHVGIGGDYDGGGGVQGLEDVSKMPHLTAELLRRGYSESDVAKVLGLNVLRVMRAAEAYARNHRR